MKRTSALVAVWMLGCLHAAEGPEKVEAAGLENVYRITDQLFSGNAPDGEAGFASLQKLGIKTVISVDGAKPDVALAKKHNLRYVHIPIGYDGVPRAQAVQLAKAVTDLPGPIYIHCHHGKHRGPAAAAVAELCADEHCKIETALELLKKAGTDPKYAGLFDSVRQFRRPTREELAGVDALPEVARLAALTQAMVAIETTWDELKLVQAAGWKTPKDHPDLDPRREATKLAEHYAEVSELPGTKERPADFRRWLTDAQAATHDLEGLLRAPRIDTAAADKLFQTAGKACTQCHAKYRDVPAR